MLSSTWRRSNPCAIRLVLAWFLCTRAGGVLSLGRVKQPRLILATEKASFHDSTASLLKTQKNKKMKKPWNELKTTNRIWKASLSPSTEKVRIAKSQVSPKRNITPPMLIIKRIMVLLLTLSFIRAAVPLVWRINITITQMNTTILNKSIAMIGPRNAPQKAPGWDRKQLQCKQINHRWQGLISTGALQHCLWTTYNISLESMPVFSCLLTKVERIGQILWCTYISLSYLPPFLAVPPML